MTVKNYPPQIAPMVDGSGNVTRAWLLYFLGIGTASATGGTVPAPTAATALDFIRINADGTAYEVQTPTQVLQDIGGLSLAEAEALFEPLFDRYQTQTAQYQVQQSDTGTPILFTTGGPCILSGTMAQGVKVIVSAGGNQPLTVQSDGLAYINGTLGGLRYIAAGESAYCEVIQNVGGTAAQWSVSANGIEIAYDGVTTGNLEGFSLSGDLSLLYGNPPLIVQSATLNNVSSGATLTLANNVTLGNTLFLVVATDLEINLPSGWSWVGTGGADRLAMCSTIASTSVGSAVISLQDTRGGAAAVLHEISGVTAQNALGPVNPTITSSGYFEAPALGTVNIPQSLYLGFFAERAISSLEPLPDWSSPTPAGTEIAAQVYGAGYVPYVMSEVVLSNANGPQTLGVYPFQNAGSGGSYFSGVQFVGMPGSSAFATLVGSPALVVNGNTILPSQLEPGLSGPSITLAGMIEFEAPNTLAAYLDAEVGTIAGQFGTVAAGPGISFSGTTLETLTVNNSGVLEIGTATGSIAIGTGLSMSGTTLVNAGVTALGTGTGSIALGANLTLASGTLGAASESVQAIVSGTAQSVGTLSAGANISFSGTAPALTISASGTVSANLTFENQGTSVGTAGTLNAGSGTTIAVSGGVATITASGGGGSRGLFTLPTMPALSGFTQQNISGTGSVIENPGKGFSIIDSAPSANVTTNRGLTIAVPSSTPYRVAIFCLYNGANFSYSGFGFGWSNGSGKFDALAYSGSQNSFGHENLSPLSNRVSNTDNAAPSLIPGASAGIWLGLRDDGAGNVFWEVSADGANYTTLYYTAKSSGYLGSSGYTNIYFGLRAYAYSVSGSNYPLSVTFLAYDPNGLSRTIG